MSLWDLRLRLKRQMTTMNVSQMLSVPLPRGRSPKLKRQTPVEDETDGHPSKSIVSDFESNSSRSLSPYWRIVMDPESSSSYLDVPETSNNSRRSSNNSGGVRFTTNDTSDMCSILDLTVSLRWPTTRSRIDQRLCFSTKPRIWRRRSLTMINTLFVGSLIFISINSISSKIVPVSVHLNWVFLLIHYRRVNRWDQPGRLRWPVTPICWKQWANKLSSVTIPMNFRHSLLLNTRRRCSMQPVVFSHTLRVRWRRRWSIITNRRYLRIRRRCTSVRCWTNVLTPNTSRCSRRRQVSTENRSIRPVIRRMTPRRSFAMFSMWLLCMVREAERLFSIPTSHFSSPETWFDCLLLFRCSWCDADLFEIWNRPQCSR